MSDICLATGLKCIRCNPGACGSRKEDKYELDDIIVKIELNVLSCPFCGESLYKDNEFSDSFGRNILFYKHPKNDCLFSECVVGDYDIKKWNTRKPIEKIIEKFEEVGDIQFSSFSKPLITVEDAVHIVKEINNTNGRV